MKCYICGTEMEFLRYGTKMGKNGKEAKWPIYAPCPNKANHRSLAKYGNLPPKAAPALGSMLTPEEGTEAHEWGQAIGTRPGSWEGILYQFEGAPSGGEFRAMVKAFIEKQGVPPVDVRVDLPVAKAILPVLQELGLRHTVGSDMAIGFKYVLLVIKQSGGGKGNG